jgi:hypothetical protein
VWRLRPSQLSILALLLTMVSLAAPWITALPPLAVLAGMADDVLVELGRDASSWLLQLAGAAGLIIGAVAFLAVQAAGGMVATRRLRTVLRSSSAAVASWFTLVLVVLEAVLLRVFAVTEQAPQLARLLGWSALALVAVFVAIGAIFLEQVHFADVYRLTPEFAREVTASAVRKFGFITGPPASLNIQRYNLDFDRTDPMGPLGELFEHAVQAHDRVLLQSICDALVGRVAAAALIPLRAPPLRVVYAERLTRSAPTSRRRARRPDDAAVVCVYVMHFFVRNAPNLRRKWRTPTGRHPFLLAGLRLLRTTAPHPELGAAVAIAAEGVAAMTLAARAEPRRATVEPYGAVALTAIDLWTLGHHKPAALLWQAYQLCHLGNPELFPRPPRAVPPAFDSIAALTARLARHPGWAPGRRTSLWIQMLPELDARAN